MQTNYLEWFGYLASLIVLISLITSSIIKLRWINLVGATLFSIYGMLLGSIPVAFMNAGIVAVDIYYLVKIYSSKESFLLIKLEDNYEYYNHFIKFYETDIKKHFNNINFHKIENSIGFYILRNLVHTGIFIATKRDENSLNIKLDYATPEYRDFKIGNFIYNKNKEFFLNQGYSKLYTSSNDSSHRKYLLKMGFEKINNSNEYIKNL